MGFVEVNIAATLRPARVSAPMRDARVTCAPEEAPFSGVSDEGLIGGGKGDGVATSAYAYDKCVSRAPSATLRVNQRSPSEKATSSGVS